MVSSGCSGPFWVHSEKGDLGGLKAGRTCSVVTRDIGELSSSLPDGGPATMMTD